MSVEAWSITPEYTVAGTGPYTITHPYVAGAIRAYVQLATGRLQLNPSEFAVSPAASETTGNLTLSPTAAATHAGQPLIIDRITPDEQGWLAVLGEREAGLAAQLDRMVQSTQELRARGAGALRTRTALEPFVWAEGTIPILEGGKPKSGPTATAIAGAQTRATEAAASAAAAAASAGQAALFDGPWLANVAALLANTSLTYTTGTSSSVATGAIVRTRAEGFAYEVAASGATDHHVATAGGVKLYQLPSNAIWYVANTGSDSNTGRTPASPFLTLNRAIAAAAVGDTIRAPGLVVREAVTNVMKMLTIEGAPGNPIIYDAFKNVTPVWSLHAGSVFKASINHDWGGVGVKEGATRLMPQLLANGHLYHEVQVGTFTLPSPYQVATEAAALALVATTPGTFYVKGLNGSSYAAGWEAGAQEYYVHTIGSVDPSTLAWRVAQRENIWPGCGIGGIIRHAVRFGGNHRDGFGLYDCLAEHVQAIYPSGHGFMVGGATAVDCAVYRGSPVIPGVNAFHSYSATLRQRTRLIRPVVRDYDGQTQNCINSHGSTPGVPTIGLIEVDDLDAENVTFVLGGLSEVRDGIILRRPRVRNAHAMTTGGPLNIRIEQPRCSFSGRGQNAIFEGVAGLDKSTEVIGPGYITGQTYLFRSLNPGGKLICRDLDFVVTHDVTNHRWFQANTSFAGARFERCALRCEGQLFDNIGVATAEVDATAPFEMIDCVLDGISAPATATLTRSFYGDSRLRLADEYGPPIKLERAPMDDSGEVSVQAVNKITNNGVRACLLVTSHGARVLDANDPREHNTLRLTVDPLAVTLRGGVFVNDATVRFGVFGAAGKLYKSNAALSAFTEVTTGRTTDWRGAVTRENGTCLLLGSAGEITEYSAVGDVLTDRISGVTYPLLRGWWDGSAYIVVGGNGTTGGILRSLDGITWTAVYTGTDAQFLRDVIKVNSVWIAVTSRNNSLLTSADGITWTHYADFQMFCNPVQIVADELYDRALVVGNIGAASGIPTGYLFNVSGANPTSWARVEIDMPFSGVQSACLWPHRLIQNNFAQSFVILTPWARAVYSMDGRRWRDVTWSARRGRLPQVAARVYLPIEASFVAAQNGA